MTDFEQPFREFWASTVYPRIAPDYERLLNTTPTRIAEKQAEKQQKEAEKKEKKEKRQNKQKKKNKKRRRMRRRRKMRIHAARISPNSSKRSGRRASAGLPI